MRQLLSTVLWFCLVSTVFGADALEVLAISPDKTWKVQHRQIGDVVSGTHLIEFVNLKSGKTLFSFTTALGTYSAFWSPDGSYVFINDRIISSGDRIFLFRAAADQITLLHSPGQVDRLSLIVSMTDDDAASKGRATLLGVKWIDATSLVIRMETGADSIRDGCEAIVRINPPYDLRLDSKSIKPWSGAE